MKTATLQYLGGLRTRMRHERSGQEVITDAPVDNNGKGEAFSPTDLLAGSFLSCMVTVMGIRATKSGMQIGEITGSVEKIMAENPRRVARLNVALFFSSHSLATHEKEILEKTAQTCPVAMSLHPEIEQTIVFNW